MKPPQSQYRDPATTYCRGVVEGNIPAGPLVHGACLRHLAELDAVQFPFEWRPEKLEAFDRFCLLLRQYKSPFAGQPLQLMPWQKFIAGSLLCWVKKSDGLRRFSTGYVEIPRKNGKSAFASALSLFMLMLDGEQGAEVYCLATKKDQAKIVYGDALKFLPAAIKNAKLRTRFDATYFDKTNSLMKPLGADSETLDGLNPHFAAADELHEWKDRRLWDVIDSGRGARSQSLMLGITTAGFVRRGITRALHDTARLLGQDAGRRDSIMDDRFCYVAAPSKDDESLWWEPRVWAISNPALGVTKRMQYMESQAAQSALEPSKLVDFKTKQLNIWCGSASSWLDIARWRAAAAEDRHDLLLSCIGQRCFSSLDLAKVTDLTASAFYFPPSGDSGLSSKHRLLFSLWCPEDKARDRKEKDGVPYCEWAEQGHITLTHGNATDFVRVRSDLSERLGCFDHQSLSFDRWGSQETIQHLQESGLCVFSHGQGFAHMTAPTLELERLLLSGDLVHDGNPVMEWQAGNVTLARDPAGQVKPDKSKSSEKIDGIVAAIMAIGGKLWREQEAQMSGAAMEIL